MVRLPPELDADAPSADARSVVLCLGSCWGVSGPAEAGDVRNSPVPVMDVLGAGGTIVRQGSQLVLGPGGRTWADG